MKKIVLAATLFLAGCDSTEEQDRKARQAIEAFGFTNIVMAGGARAGGVWNGCDSHDFFARPFTATNSSNQRVRGVACGGFFKEWTVRVSGLANEARLQ